MKRYLFVFIFFGLIYGQSDFSLEDINPSSETYGEYVGPSYFSNDVLILGFFHENWGSCRARFGLLNDLYLDLISENIADVKIIGVGKDQFSSSLDDMINGRVLPWVQDSSSTNYAVWSNFDANQRDIFFINIDGQIDTSFNITPYNPSNPDDVMYIKDLILSFREDYSSSLSSNNKLVPRSFALYQNFPNPFNPSTTIAYSLNEKSYVHVVVYDLSGSLVKTLFYGSQDAGYNSLVWDSTNNENKPISGGLYIYSVSTDNSLLSKKMLLLK